MITIGAIEGNGIGLRTTMGTNIGEIHVALHLLVTIIQTTDMHMWMAEYQSREVGRVWFSVVPHRFMFRNPKIRWSALQEIRRRPGLGQILVPRLPSFVVDRMVLIANQIVLCPTKGARNLCCP